MEETSGSSQVREKLFCFQTGNVDNKKVKENEKEIEREEGKDAFEK